MDDEQAFWHLANSNIRLMSTSLKQDICDLGRPGALTADIDNDRIQRHIPPGFQYACISWVQHLQMGSARLSDNGQVLLEKQVFDTTNRILYKNDEWINDMRTLYDDLSLSS